MILWKSLRFEKGNAVNRPDTGEFHGFLKFLGKGDLSARLRAEEDAYKRAIPGEVAFYCYEVKYKVSAMDNGLLFEVKYKMGTKRGTAPVVLWGKEETFTVQIKFWQ